MANKIISSMLAAASLCIINTYKYKLEKLWQ